MKTSIPRRGLLCFSSIGPLRTRGVPAECRDWKPPKRTAALSSGHPITIQGVSWLIQRLPNIEFSCPAASAQHCMEYETECTATSDL